MVHELIALSAVVAAAATWQAVHPRPHSLDPVSPDPEQQRERSVSSYLDSLAHYSQDCLHDNAHLHLQVQPHWH